MQKTVKCATSRCVHFTVHYYGDETKMGTICVMYEAEQTDVPTFFGEK
jgi:hypothetical protein